MLKALRWFLIPYLLFLIVGIGYYFSHDHGDFVLLLNKNRIALLDFSMPWITHLGDGLFFALVTLIFVLYRWRVGMVVLALGLTQLITSYLLKRQVFRGTPRPKTFFAELEVPLSFIEGVKVHSYNSFPSGHTMTAFAIFFFLSCYFQRRLFSVLFFTLALAVAISRVYLLQHFLIDVCVGSIVGIILGFIAYKYSQKVDKTQQFGN